jgi:curved DNA-binding protein CbpA
MTDATPGAITQEEQEAIEALYELILTGDNYAVLGVSPDADVAHIRRAYYGMSRSWHPDQFYRRAIGEWRERIDEVFAGINRAYQVLSDPESRAAYDAGREPDTGRPGVAAPTSAVLRAEAESEVLVTEEVPGVVHEVDLRRDRLKVSPTSVAGAGEAATPRRRLDVPGMKKLKAQIQERLTKARQASEKAIGEARDGRWIQAAADMYIATRFDPENAEYQRLWKEYDPKGRLQTAQQCLAMAETALQYHDLRRAITHLETAVAVNPPLGDPYYQLATLKAQLAEDDSPREATALLRKAVEKSPDNVRFRLALASTYLQAGLKAKARHEYEEVLRREPENAEAKTGLRRSR